MCLKQRVQAKADTENRYLLPLCRVCGNPRGISKTSHQSRHPKRHCRWICNQALIKQKSRHKTCSKQTQERNKYEKSCIHKGFHLWIRDMSMGYEKDILTILRINSNSHRNSNHPRCYLYFFTLHHTYYLIDNFRKRRVKSEELIVKE